MSMIPKAGQHPDAPRQRLYKPRHPALAVTLTALGIAVLLAFLTLG